MAEVQRATNAGETTQQFIEFVMMQAQNASLFLGLIPHPQNNEPEVNLPLARMFIDQLSMIQEKTRGNLSNEETGVLRNALSNLQMAYVEVAKGGGAELPTAAPVRPAETPAELASSPVESTPLAAAASPEPADDNRESKKRFTKSYGS